MLITSTARILAAHLVGDDNYPLSAEALKSSLEPAIRRLIEIALPPSRMIKKGPLRHELRGFLVVVTCADVPIERVFIAQLQR